MDLYVNPRGESRRWDKFRVLPTISTEIVLMRDLDGDGKPEIIFGGGGVYAWAHRIRPIRRPSGRRTTSRAPAIA